MYFFPYFILITDLIEKETPKKKIFFSVLAMFLGDSSGIFCTDSESGAQIFTIMSSIFRTIGLNGGSRRF